MISAGTGAGHGITNYRLPYRDPITILSVSDMYGFFFVYHIYIYIEQLHNGCRSHPYPTYRSDCLYTVATVKGAQGTHPVTTGDKCARSQVRRDIFEKVYAHPQNLPVEGDFGLRILV